MAFDPHTNFAYSLVATAPSPAGSGTTLSVSAGQGALFPAAPFNCTVWPVISQSLSTNAEIIRVTSKGTGDNWTIVRTQEGSSARNILVGDQIAATITAKTLQDVEGASYPPTVHDMITVHSYTGGVALDVFGLSAPDTIARLTPSSSPGAAAAILCTTSAGLLTLAALTVNSIVSASLGNANAGFGTGTLGILTTGANNTAMGVNALGLSLTTGNSNTALGHNAMVFATGNNNMAIGESALAFVTGDENIGIGVSALQSTVGAQGNVVIGFQSGFSNTTGYKNTAIGWYAMRTNTTGFTNTAIGEEALYSNLGGDHNLAVGAHALYNNTSGIQNTGLGIHALDGNTTGNNNLGVGWASLFSHQTGDGNIAVGFDALYSNLTGTGLVALGFEAGYFETGSNKLFIDNQRRANEADARVKALVYGVFDAIPANQLLTVNGNVGIGKTPTTLLDVAGKIRTDVTLNAGLKVVGHYFTMNVSGTDVNVLCE